MLALVAAVAAALVWLVRSSGGGWVEPIERALIYFPSRAAAFPPSAVGGPVEEVRFGERARLHGWFVPGARPGTILIFHGNGGNLTDRAPLLARMRAETGAALFIFDYQGYGQSEGVPSEAGTYGDARAALAYLHGRPDVDPARIVYLGESLGAAVAADLAVEAAPRALVLQAPFTSIADMARVHYPLLAPLLPLVRTRYDTLAKIGGVRAPLTIVHGTRDDVVPLDQARRLHAAANEPKRLLVVEGAGHNDLPSIAGAAYWQALREALGEWRPRGVTPSGSGALGEWRPRGVAPSGSGALGE